MIATAIWVGVLLWPRPEFQQDLADLRMGALPPLAWAAGGAWLLWLSVGLLLLTNGVARSKGGRDAMVAAKSLAWLAVAGVALCFRARLPDWQPLQLAILTVCVWIVAGGGTQLALALRGMREQHLPEPSTIPDLPMSGPASREEARRGMSGEFEWSPPRFRE